MMFNGFLARSCFLCKKSKTNLLVDFEGLTENDEDEEAEDAAEIEEAVVTISCRCVPFSVFEKKAQSQEGYMGDDVEEEEVQAAED